MSEKIQHEIVNHKLVDLQTLSFEVLRSSLLKLQKYFRRDLLPRLFQMHKVCHEYCPAMYLNRHGQNTDLDLHNNALYLIGHS